jgi:hypothetical protein
MLTWQSVCNGRILFGRAVEETHFLSKTKTPLVVRATRNGIAPLLVTLRNDAGVNGVVSRGGFA